MNQVASLGLDGNNLTNSVVTTERIEVNSLGKVGVAGDSFINAGEGNVFHVAFGVASPIGNIVLIDY